MVKQQRGAHERRHLFTQCANTGKFPIDQRQGVALPEEIGAVGVQMAKHLWQMSQMRQGLPAFRPQTADGGDLLCREMGSHDRHSPAARAVEHLDDLGQRETNPLLQPVARQPAEIGQRPLTRGVLALPLPQPIGRLTVVRPAPGGCIHGLGLPEPELILLLVDAKAGRGHQPTGQAGEQPGFVGRRLTLPVGKGPAVIGHGLGDGRPVGQRHAGGRLQHLENHGPILLPARGCSSRAGHPQDAGCTRPHLMGVVCQRPGRPMVHTHRRPQRLAHDRIQ